MQSTAPHTIRYTQGEKNSYLISSCLVFFFELIVCYGLYREWGFTEDFTIASIASSAVLLPITIYLYLTYRFINNLDISIDDEWINYSSNSKLETFRIEEITSIAHQSLLRRLVIKTAESSISIPKHNTLFEPFYQHLQENLIETWEKTSGEFPIVCKEHLKNKWSLFVSIPFLLYAIYISLESNMLTFQYNDSAIFFIIISTLLFTLALFKRSYKLYTHGILIKELGQSCFLPFSDIQKVAFEAGFPSDDVLIKTQKGYKYRLSEYNFPIDWVHTYINKQITHSKNHTEA